MDALTYRIVVCILGMVSLSSVAVAGYCGAIGKETPQVIVATLAGAVGGLLGVLQRPNTPGPQGRTGEVGPPGRDA